MSTMSVVDLKPHKLSTEIYGDEEPAADFVQSIARDGILTPLSVLKDGTIISGHRRWRVAKMLGLAEVPVYIQGFNDTLDVERAVIESNRQREKLFSHRMREAEVIERIETARAKQRQGQRTNFCDDRHRSKKPKRATDAVAEAVGMGSGRQYSRAKKVWEAAKSGDVTAKELVEKLDSKEITVTSAIRVLNKDRQKKERKKRVENTLEQLPAGKFRAIIIDPPWPVQKIIRDVRPNQDTMDYPTMTVEEIGRLPVQEQAFSDGCHVYLWTTHKHLPDALELFKKWGVKYQCLITWVKPTGMTPFSWMYNTEHALFGRIGSLKVERMGLKLSFEAPVTRHSEKPPVFYEIVRQASPGPRLEMFARSERDGFVAWGDEIGIQNRS